MNVGTKVTTRRCMFFPLSPAFQPLFLIYIFFINSFCLAIHRSNIYRTHNTWRPRRWGNSDASCMRFNLYSNLPQPPQTPSHEKNTRKNSASLWPSLLLFFSSIAPLAFCFWSFLILRGFSCKMRKIIKWKNENSFRVPNGVKLTPKPKATWEGERDGNEKNRRRNLCIEKKVSCVYSSPQTPARRLSMCVQRNAKKIRRGGKNSLKKYFIVVDFCRHISSISISNDQTKSTRWTHIDFSRRLLFSFVLEWNWEMKFKKSLRFCCCDC